MTTVQLDLPDQLAQEAERAGLLSAPALEEWLRKQLKQQAAAELDRADSSKRVRADEWVSSSTSQQQHVVVIQQLEGSVS